jgi:hypothetical protein
MNPNVPVMFAMFGVMILVWVIISACVLRMGVALFNWLASEEERVEKPTLTRTVAITFARTGIQMSLSVASTFAFAWFGTRGTMTPRVTGFLSSMNLVSFPVTFVVGGAIIMALLPTTFGKALLIEVAELAIIIVLGLAVASVLIPVFYFLG